MVQEASEDVTDTLDDGLAPVVERTMEGEQLTWRRVKVRVRVKGER